MPSLDKLRIAVIGLGYICLPLVAYLGQHFEVKGFDIATGRVGDLALGLDRTKEVTREELAAAGTKWNFHQ